MAKNTFDVIYMDDDQMMADLFSQFIGWKYPRWRAHAFTNPVLLHRELRAGDIEAKVWIIDIMMPEINGCQIAAAIREHYGQDQVILGYTALEPETLHEDPQYSTGLHLFTRIVRKNEGMARLLSLADTLLESR